MRRPIARFETAQVGRRQRRVGEVRQSRSRRALRGKGGSAGRAVLKNQLMTPSPASAPSSCATMNIGTSPGAMPRSCRQRRAIVTAGFAKDVMP